ncbi:MAG: DUF692 family protein [Oligoflexia bacterium]|nr:DUF692 family protein [Oligoflexia bacterium]
MINLVLPVSNIIKEFPLSFINSFKTLEYKYPSPLIFPQKDKIFHSSFSLVQDDFERIYRESGIASFIIKNRIRRFSLDAGPCFTVFKVVDNQYIGEKNRLTSGDLMMLCRKRIKFLRQLLPEQCEIAVENLNYYNTSAYDGVCTAEFYNELCKNLQIRLVLDIAHAFVTDYNLYKNRKQFIDLIDANNVCEVHLSKMRVESSGAIDAHELPDEVEINALSEFMTRRNVKSNLDVVVEHYKNASGVMTFYTKIMRTF